MRKYSLYDIIFFIILIMTKSASDQPQSRAEMWSNKKNVFNIEAKNVSKCASRRPKEASIL